MFNDVVVLALIALQALWSWHHEEEHKRQKREAEYRELRHEAFEVRTVCIAYYRITGKWPTSGADLNEFVEMASVDKTDYTLWYINAHYEPRHAKQWLLDIWLVDSLRPNMRIRRIFNTNVR